MKSVYLTGMLGIGIFAVVVGVWPVALALWAVAAYVWWCLWSPW